MNHPRRLAPLGAALTLLAAALLGTSSTAFAAPSDEAAQPASTAGAVSSTVRDGDAICEQMRAADGAPGPCATEMVASVSDAHPITAAEVAEYGHLQAENGKTLREAADEVTSAALYCRTWYQEQHGFYYLNWKEKHVGKFCYNGSDVWIWAKGGYHYCDRGYGIGYDIDVQNCDENKIYVNTKAGYGRQNWDYYQVHIIWKGIPMYASYDMHANVYPSGNAYFYW